MRPESVALPSRRVVKWLGFAAAIGIALVAGALLDRFTWNQRSPGLRGVMAVPDDRERQSGVVTHGSPWGVAETLRRLKDAFAAKGLKVFVDIDQQAEARAAGLDQPPMHLLLVGNPRSGTPVMAAVPQAGLDLPLKVLVWEGPPGETHVGLNSADYLGTRHGLAPEVLQPLRGLESLVQGVLSR
jgi:uncharacterized protein (DUF302 family)